MAAVKKLIGQVYYMGAGYLYTGLDLPTLKELFSGPAVLLFLLQLFIPLMLSVRGLWALRTCNRDKLALLATFFVPTFLFLAYEGSPANLVLPFVLPYLLVLGAGAASSGRALPSLLVVLWLATVSVQSGRTGYAIHPEDWRSLSAHIQEQATSRDAVFLTGSRNSIFTTDYYPVSPAMRYSVVDSALVKARLDAHVTGRSRSVANPVRRLLEKHENVWFVYIDYDMPFMERSVDSLWVEAGRSRTRFGEGLELLLLSREEE
jgi:hypothetical protein